MSDVLNMLEQLENEERAEKRAAASAAKRKPAKASSTSGRSGRPRTRSVKSASHKKSSSEDLDNLPPPVIGTGRLTPIPKHRPSAPSPTQSRDSSVGGDSRRISFAEPAPPPARRLHIPTKTASLASGFIYDLRLQKYGVLESEWSQFSDEIVSAANVPTPAWTWFIQKKDFIKRMKRELQYESDIKRVLRTWNKHFKRKGFQVWLELPLAKGDPPRSQSADQDNSSDEDAVQSRKDEKKSAKKFRVTVSSNVDKGSSVYSRTSSLTRSVSREGVTGNHQHRAAQKAHEKATEHAAEQEGRIRSSADDKEVGQVVKIDTVDSVGKSTLEKGDSTDKLETPDSKDLKTFDSTDGSNGKEEQEITKAGSSGQTHADPEPKATTIGSDMEANSSPAQNASNIEAPVEVESNPEGKIQNGHATAPNVDQTESPIETPVIPKILIQNGEALGTKNDEVGIKDKTTS